MRILVAGIPSSPFEHTYKVHYSIFKSFGTAVGFADLGHEVFLMSKKLYQNKDGVQLKPHKDIDIDFVKTLDLVVFTVERGIEKAIDASQGLLWLENEKLSKSSNHLPKMVVKMGGHRWMDNSRWGKKRAHELFDYFFAQEPGFADAMREDFKDSKKIFHSRMGVFKEMPLKSKNSPFKLFKNNLFYMGRMRHSPSKMPFLIDVMSKLGSDFHLNILPGSFSKPPELLDRLNSQGKNKFGAQTEENFQWLVNYFSKCKNITIHRPANWGDHWDYLYHSDIGLDLSPHWKETKSTAGNAKLLEYMAAGLPTVTEPSVGNVEVLKQASGGLITSKTGDVDIYCDAIRNISNMIFNRQEISRITIKNNNWKIRAKDMLRDMELK